MSTRVPRPPIGVRLLLRSLSHGQRRDEIASDLAELFETRLRTRGRIYAYWRLFRDLASVMRPPSPPSQPTVRDRTGGVRGWLLDLRYGLRLLRKHPAIIGATVGGLALA